MAEDALLAEMRALRDRVIGVTDTALASRDGLIIRSDTDDLDPDNLAALAAASLGLAQRMAAEVGKGTLRQAVTRSSDGLVAVYAIGTKALLVVIADAGADTVRLDREASAAAETIEALLPGGRGVGTTAATGLPVSAASGSAPPPECGVAPGGVATGGGARRLARAI